MFVVGTPGDSWDGGEIAASLRNHDNDVEDSNDSLSMLTEYATYFQKLGLLGDSDIEKTTDGGDDRLNKSLLDGATVKMENGISSEQLTVK